MPLSAPPRAQTFTEEWSWPLICPGRTVVEAPFANPMNESAPLFDPALIRRRITRARRAGFADFLLGRVLDDLEDRLATVTRPFPLALDLGTPLPNWRSD